MEKFLLALYVVVAIAMIGFILMQRGPGAQAGSGFGSGASGTVFGARGSANFLSSSTKWLAIAFFAISIAMGAYISRMRGAAGPDANLGVMATETAPKPTPTAAPADASVPSATAPAVTTPTTGDAPAATPAATDPSVPAATSAPATTDAVPAATDAAPAAPVEAAPAATPEVEKKDSESSQSGSNTL